MNRNGNGSCMLLLFNTDGSTRFLMEPASSMGSINALQEFRHPRPKAFQLVGPWSSQVFQLLVNTVSVVACTNFLYPEMSVKKRAQSEHQINNSLSRLLVAEIQKLYLSDWTSGRLWFTELLNCCMECSVVVLVATNLSNFCCSEAMRSSRVCFSCW